MLKCWYADDALRNATHLHQTQSHVFSALGEIDRAGHAVLENAMATYQGRPWETTLGLALTRRSIAQFAGVRYLLERSAVQAATLPARAHFETLLAARYFVYGTRRSLSGLTPTTARGRETRARYYRTEEVRREVYRRQSFVDGQFGGRSPGASTRAGIKEEIDERILWLNRHFPVQQRSFGPLRCFPVRGKRAMYFDEYPWHAFGFSASRHRSVRSIRGLANAFGWIKDYELLYDAFSGFAHVRGLHHDTEVEPGSIAVRVPHTPEDFETVASVVAERQLFMLFALGRAFAPQAWHGVRDTAAAVGPVLDTLAGSVPLGFS